MALPGIAAVDGHGSRVVETHLRSSFVNRSLQPGVRQGSAAKGAGHRDGGRQQSCLAELHVVIAVALGLAALEVRPCIRHHVCVNHAGSGFPCLPPQGLTPDLDEVRIVLALGNHAVERIRRHAGALALHGSDQSIGAGRGIESTDAEMLRPVPERRAHRVEAAFHIGSAGQNQQERRLSAYALAGIEQRPAQGFAEVLRFVERQRQRAPLAARGQQPGQRCAPSVKLPPRRREPDGEVRRIRQQ